MKQQQQSTPRRRWSAVAVLAVILCSPAWFVLEAEEQTTVQAAPATQAAAQNGSQEETVTVSPLPGMVVSIDPATGRVREPSRAELEALKQAMSLQFRRTAPAFQPRQAASGMLSLVVAFDEMNYAVARYENGRAIPSCVEGLDKAADFLLQTSALEEK
ncbi:MAG TPA: hypothetical protein PK413_00240 [Thermoanaerobaculia bacterium]|nr:hypothetical protein [Thermoanaerobaculia bacterium]